MKTKIADEVLPKTKICDDIYTKTTLLLTTIDVLGESPECACAIYSSGAALAGAAMATPQFNDACCACGSGLGIDRDDANMNRCPRPSLNGQNWGVPWTVDLQVNVDRVPYPEGLAPRLRYTV